MAAAEEGSMNTMSISVGISHTPWIPERVASLARLLESLNHDDFTLFADREPNHVWSERMWSWAAGTKATHCLFLQDDVQIAPNFWCALSAMLAAASHRVIGLETAHSAARLIAAEGGRWCTTTDGLIGVGYVLPREQLLAFLRWRRTELEAGALEVISEDTLLGLWCAVTGHNVLHPIPTIIDHDTSLASTYGNDRHANRRPVVTWKDSHGPDTDGHKLESPSFWCGSALAPHLGRFYETTPDLARRAVKGFTDAERLAMKRDDGKAVQRRLVIRRRARAEPRDIENRVVVCTPTRGTPAPEYTSTLMQLVATGESDPDASWIVTNVFSRSDSIVHARSRMVHDFLESDGTHLFFVDDDQSFRPVVLKGMLASGHDVVCAPYPRREGVDFESVTKNAGLAPPEALAYRYSVTLKGHPHPAPLELDVHDCAEIEGIGFGCTLISRAALERMVAHYDEELGFADMTAGGRRVVALFQLTFAGEPRQLYGEDTSFCRRWRDIDGRVMMYLGPGSPIDHHGAHAYKGCIEAFGLVRSVHCAPAQQP
jgi:hypothetical protein